MKCECHGCKEKATFMVEIPKDDRYSKGPWGFYCTQCVEYAKEMMSGRSFPYRGRFETVFYDKTGKE